MQHAEYAKKTKKDAAQNWQITATGAIMRRMHQAAAGLRAPWRDPNGPLAPRGVVSAPWVLPTLSGSWLPGSLFGVAAWILGCANSEPGGNGVYTRDYGGCFRDHTRGTWPSV